MNTRLIHKGQRGLSLVELVIAIALTGIITSAITMTVFQVFNMNTRTSNRMAAVSQVQHAGKLVSEDILQAKAVTPGGESGFPLILTWTEVVEDGNTYHVEYKLGDMSGGLKILWREYYVNRDIIPDPVSITKVAEYIDPDQTSCNWDGSMLTFKVTARVGTESETRVYQVKPRPGS